MEGLGRPKTCPPKAICGALRPCLKIRQGALTHKVLRINRQKDLKFEI